MTPDEILAALAFVPEVRATSLQNRMTIHVPALGDSVHLVADDVRRARRIYAPDGAPALEFAIGAGAELWPLIITGTDVVFQPVSPDTILDTRMRYAVAQMPPLVAYTEILREAEAQGRRVQSGHIDYDTLAGTFLLVRCFILGAARFGLRPVAAVGWWDRGWRRVGDSVFLPPWRVDPLWDGLLAEAAQLPDLPSTLTAVRDERPDAARIEVADFARLEPGLRVVGLDDEFVAAWRRWMPITPATFHATLTRGVPDATADVALYPDGGGSINLWVPLGDSRRAFLQTSFVLADGDIAVDEIRIPDGVGGGLFQRLMFNTERLAALLGLRQVSLRATGIGAYALARVGVYPRDPELYRVTRDRT
ncbi:hypothetical protein AB0F68_34990 [Micromonospora sp. NPDC023966]|uniref:hypothetical protein n=1 Tax=Micromonospora sp. NPDC023966 TaxID=3154699 RepID=UPI0033D55CB5